MPSAATESSGRFSPDRFGVALGALRLLTPPDRPAQYIASAPIHPLPLAPRRLRGLAQVRGHPVSVLDAAQRAPAQLPTRQRHALLVVGDPGQAPIGLLVDGPPVPLQVVEAASPPPGPPALPFASVLHSPMLCRDGPHGMPTAWWQADFSALFEALMADR
ncbi:MAG: hypothetical protein QM674_02660 [Burkholderiaceae bacterium]